MICRNDIIDLKEDIAQKIGQKIIVKGSLGRSKPFEKQAIIERTYPSIFTVKYEQEEKSVTYSYTDILTRTVEVSVYNGEEYTPLIPPVEDKKMRKIP